MKLASIPESVIDVLHDTINSRVPPAQAVGVSQGGAVSGSTYGLKMQPPCTGPGLVFIAGRLVGYYEFVSNHVSLLKDGG